jgi:DNA-binding beta-propeller fold protein YncE
LALSPDGRWLYSTSEIETNLARGTLSVINVAAAEHDPARAVMATVAAHCLPVRVVVSRDGGTVWVTARESDQLLAFSSAKLRTDPAHALLAAVRVGEAPVVVDA